MNEVLQTDFKNESVTLEHKELKRIINNWRLLLIVCFLWALGAVFLLFFGFLSMQTIDRSNADYGIQYTLIFGGLWPLVTILSVISKTTWGRVIGIISCWMMLIVFPFGTILGILGLVGLSRAKLLYGIYALDYREIKKAYKQPENYTVSIEDRKKKEAFAETTYMSVGSFICGIMLILFYFFGYILIKLVPPFPGHTSPLFSEAAPLIWIMGFSQIILLPASLILGFITLWRIKKKIGNKKDLIFAILGLMIGGTSTALMLSDLYG